MFSHWPAPGKTSCCRGIFFCFPYRLEVRHTCFTLGTIAGTRINVWALYNPFLIPTPQISNRLQSALLRNALKQVPALHSHGTQHSGTLNLSRGYIWLSIKYRDSQQQWGCLNSPLHNWEFVEESYCAQQDPGGIQHLAQANINYLIWLEREPKHGEHLIICTIFSTSKVFLYFLLPL